MKLNEAQEILAKHGFKMQLNECGGYASGGYRRPPKPSPDAEWVDGCYGGHWHVPTEQDKRRRAYNAKKDTAIGDKMQAMRSELHALNSERSKAIAKHERAVLRECNKVLNQVLNNTLKQAFEGWYINEINVLRDPDALGYSFVATQDDYSWRVTCEKYLGTSFGWRVSYESPKGQKISRSAEKNSSYYTQEIRSIAERVNAKLDAVLENVDGYIGDFDTSEWDSKVNAKHDEMVKTSNDYDEENGWDSRRNEFKANLTPKGNLKKKIVRHESTEVDDAKQLLESAGFICENATQEQIAYCEEVVKAWAAMYKRKTGTNHFGWCYTKDEKESAIYALADLIEEDIGDEIDYSVDPKVTAKQFYAEITHLSDY